MVATENENAVSNLVMYRRRVEFSRALQGTYAAKAEAEGMNGAAVVSRGSAR